MEKYTVTLEKNHTHKGKKYNVGEEINVSLTEAEFLANARVIKKIPKATALKTQNEEKQNA